MIGGHEGAGIVQEVGPGVRDLKVGDHVVASFLPACGTLPLVCERGTRTCAIWARSSCWAFRPTAPTDATRAARMSASWRASEASPSTGTVSETSVVKVDDDLPLSRACLLGCGVMTGWGSAVNTADVTPGDTVVVIGCGGIGSGAIQGARLGRRRAHRRRRNRGSQAGQGIRVRRHALRHLDAGSHGVGRRPDPRA